MHPSQISARFQEKFPELKAAMSASNHHFEENGKVVSLNPYHLEGDVWTHTSLVMQRSEKFGNITRLAALCHDLGKPLAREQVMKDEIGKTRFFNHGSLSVFEARSVLKEFPELNLTHDDIIEVMMLINYHQELFELFNTKDLSLEKCLKSEAFNQFISHGYIFILHLLELMECDANGRFMVESQLEKNEIFNFNIEWIKHELATSHIFESPSKVETNNNPWVCLLIGVPGSGKSTFRNNIKDDFITISRDDKILEIANGMKYTEAFQKFGQDKRIDETLLKDFRVAVQLNKNIVVDMTNMSAKSRRKWLSMTHKNYNKKAVIFLPDEKELQRRFKYRNELEDKFIPDHVLLNMKKNLALPLKSEFHQISYVWG